MSAAENRAVFLSYASQDAAAAQSICEALRAAGVEVWLDQGGGLVGGDAWDVKIRAHIATCALFVPIISANTQARLEGYFRLEWKLAAQRTHTMADEKAFLLPVVIDHTRDAEAKVPGEFKSVQWSRLPDGETSATFCARVQQLLAGSDPAVWTSSSPFGRTPGAEVRGRGRNSSAWLLPALLGAAVLVTLAIWRPWQRTSAAAAAPLTEARQYTLKARALIDDDPMAVRENFRLAEELAEKAVKLAPDDGEAWATLARVSAEMISRRYDTTKERAAAARSQVERANRLAPDTVETGLAMAAHLMNNRDVPAAETRLRALLQRATGDARVAYALSVALDILKRTAEGSEIRLRHPSLGERNARALVGEAASLRQQGRLVEALERAEQSQAITPSRSAYFQKLLILAFHWGDLASAQAHVEKLPSVLLEEDAFAHLAADLWLRLGESAKVLDALRRIPRDFFEESRAIFPKGYLSGRALQLDGRLAAADAEWRAALAVLERRLATEPNRPILLRWKAVLLALTQQAGEAERIWKLFAEFSRNSAPENSRDALESDMVRAEMLLALNRVPEAIASIHAVGPLLTYFRYDPWFAPLRNDPRIRAMIDAGVAELEGQRLRAPVASTATVTSARPAQSVAVLAFTNIPDDKSTEYFSDGISEELLNVLAKIPGLKVTARTSSFHFKGRNTPIPEIAQQLGVAYVVEGSVQKADNRVRIKATLIKAADGFQVWSDRFDKELKDIFALQDEIAGLIAKNLTLKLGAGSPGITTAAPTKNLDAHDFYLRGRALQTGAQSSTIMLEAVNSYEEATKRDPHYALAWARLAQALLRMFSGGFDSSEQTGKKARDAAATALRLDPRLPEAHVAMAQILEAFGEDEAAERELDEARWLQPGHAEVPAVRVRLERTRGNRAEDIPRLVADAIALDPQNAYLFEEMGGALRAIGQFAEAERLFLRAWDLSQDADSAVRNLAINRLTWTGDVEATLKILESLPPARSETLVQQLYAELHTMRGDIPAALAAYERQRVFVTSGRMTTSGPRAGFLHATYRMAQLETRRGNAERTSALLQEGLSAARQYIQDFPTVPAGPLNLAFFHAARGDSVAARAALNEADRIMSRRPGLATSLRRIELLALLGEKAVALAELQTMNDRGRVFGYRLRLSAEWDLLRDEPKFQQLMKSDEAAADAQPRPKK